MKTKESLIKLTEEFFKKHWCEEVIKDSPQQWSDKYFLQGSMPNHDSKGYMHF